ncbi:MAG TPA: class I SAM-dependent methyltransferase [Solirubrobacteraceae bacterium]
MGTYYYPEHEQAYARIEREGKTGWDELHGGTGFDDFSSRDFLERALEMLRPPPAETDVLEYGCGTGPGACFLAARGFRVDAIDLIPRAIALARRLAAERGLAVDFAIRDVCALADERPEKRYGLIVDSYCLQSVVLDADRARLFAAVRARLKPTGRYLISTAMHDPARRYDVEDVHDERTGCVWSRLGGEAERHRDVAGARRIGGVWHLPNRRHLRPAALRAELAGAGFEVLWQGGHLGGEVICAHARDAEASLPSSAPG